MPAADPATHLLDVPGARLYYERRGSGPLLLMIGSPMDSTGFAGLASALAGMARWRGPGQPPCGLDPLSAAVDLVITASEFRLSQGTRRIRCRSVTGSPSTHA